MSNQIAQPHFEGLETAFLQLSFAMKLWHYLLERPVSRSDFDIALTVADDCGSLYVMSHNEFKSDDDVALAAGNNIAICFGVTAITLWEAIRENSGISSAALEPSRSQRDATAGLAYALRCCFAHGTTQPRWDLRPKYRIVFRLGNRNVDLTNVDGTPFEYEQIGGIDSIRLLRDQAAAMGLLS